MASVVRALYDYDAPDSNGLSFRKNDLITVLNKLESGWWDGLCNGIRGWFPSNYIVPVEASGSQQEERSPLPTKPDDWIAQSTPEGDYYFINLRTGAVTWEPPEGVTLSSEVERALYNVGGSVSSGHAPLTPSLSSSRNSNILPGTSSPRSRSLPPPWTIRETAEGYQYFNTKTGESTWVPPNEALESAASAGAAAAASEAVMETRRKKGLNSRTQSSQDLMSTASNLQNPSGNQLPSPWGSKTTPEGRIYYYNMLTNETTWSLNEVFRKSNSKIGPIPQSPPGSDDESPSTPFSPMYSRRPTLQPTSDLDGEISRANGGDQWSMLLNSIVTSLSKVASAANMQNKAEYIQLVYFVVAAIRRMLLVSDTADRDGQLLRSLPLLKKFHASVIESVHHLVDAAKLASAVWPPPDAPKRLHSDVGKVLAAVRHFVAEAVKAGVVIKQVDGNTNPHGDEQISPGSDAIFSENPKLPKQRPRSTIGTAPYVVSIVQRLDDASTDTKEAVRILLAAVSKGQRAEIPSLTQTCVSHAGQLLEVSDELDVEAAGDERISQLFSVAQTALRNSVSTLMSAVRVIDSPLAPPNALATFATEATVVSHLTGDLVVASKHLLDALVSHGVSMEAAIPGDADVSRDMSASGDDAPIRRALSLNFVQQADKKEHMTHDKGTVGNKELLKAVLRSGSHANINLDQNNPGAPIGRPRLKTDPYQQQSTVPSHLAASTPALTVTDQDYESDDNEKQRKAKMGGQSKLLKIFGENVSSESLKTDKKSEEQKKNEKPWFLQPDYSKDDLLFGSERQVKGGTLPALVEQLTFHEYSDSRYIQCFLWTYKSFSTTQQVLDLLEKRFDLSQPPSLSADEVKLWTEAKLGPIRLRVINVLKLWIETYLDEDEEHVVLPKVKAFCTRRSQDSRMQQLLTLIDKRERKDGTLKKLVRNAGLPPTPIVPKNLKNIKFMDLDPLEIARQLSLMASNMYSQIKPVECLQKSWSEKPKPGEPFKAVNIRAIIENSNQLTGWVAETILHESDIKKRTNVMKHFIMIAEKCATLRNFNTLMAILAGLNATPIHRLKRTWEMLPSKVLATLDALKAMMDNKHNFSAYRKLLQQGTGTPCVPFLGVYLTDLTFIEDGNQDCLASSNNIINFDKRLKTSTVISEIQSFQISRYDFTEVKEVRSFLENKIKTSRLVQDLYDISMELEPKETEETRITRTLMESGLL